MFLKSKKVKANIQATYFYTIFENQFKNFMLLWRRIIVRFIYVDWYTLTPFWYFSGNKYNLLAMSSKTKYKSKFLDEWHEKVEFKDWPKKFQMTLQ